MKYKFKYFTRQTRSYNTQHSRPADIPAHAFFNGWRLYFRKFYQRKRKMDQRYVTLDLGRIEKCSSSVWPLLLDENERSVPGSGRFDSIVTALVNFRKQNRWHSGLCREPGGK
jgi:hypothetical protein